MKYNPQKHIQLLKYEESLKKKEKMLEEKMTLKNNLWNCQNIECN